MEVLAQTELPPLLARSYRPLAAVGLLLALTGLVVAVGAPAFMETAPSTDLPHALAEGAHKIKDHLAHKNVDVKSGPLISWKIVLTASGAILGFLGAALGTASFARRERWRLSGIAIAVGLAAIAWNHFVAAAVAAVALFLMAWVVSHFHR